MADPGDLSTWHGISLGSLLSGAGIWTGLAGIGTYWIRSRPAMRKMRLEADASLRAELLERLALVERTAEERVGKLEKKLDDQRSEYETRMALKDAKFDREMAILRHRANNMAQCLDAIVMLVEASPNDASSHIVKVKEMRARQEIAEAAEKGAFAGDKIAAITG